MEVEKDNYTEAFVAQFPPTPATTCTIEESERMDLECVIIANGQTYIRHYSVDYSSTNYTAVVQESAAQNVPADETLAEHSLHYSTQETEEGNSSTSATTE